MSESNATTQPIGWHQSLIVRVMVLCGVLVVCLLGSVYVLTRYYYGEVAGEMESRATQIAAEIEIALGEIEGEDEIVDIERRSNDLIEEPWIDLEFFDGDATNTGQSAAAEAPNVYSTPRMVTIGGQSYWVVARFTVQPQTEILRAFKNRYLMALTVVFVIALSAMVVLIAKTLRPLREFSNSCADISEGNLRTINTRGSTGEIQALEGTFNRMVASLREKETVEANLRQAQRLSAVGNLAAGVAHDVRNPLNAIKLLSSHALDTLNENGSDASAAKHIRTIRDEVNRLEEIVSGFLSLAKEEELRRTPHVIDAVLRECVHLVQKDAEDRQVRLITELRCGDTELSLDEKHWTRAIINVLINAFEACPPGGRVRLFSRMTDRDCEIEVRDDGPGMPKEVLERVFDPYYTTKTTGTGLGLSITRGIVEEHGGAISITSYEGQGCQVLITLPLNVTATNPERTELKMV